MQAQIAVTQSVQYAHPKRMPLELFTVDRGDGKDGGQIREPARSSLVESRTEAGNSFKRSRSERDRKRMMLVPVELRWRRAGDNS